MKKFKLSLKKESITQLNKSESEKLKGGNNFYESRLLCMTIDYKWDCGGSMTCDGPFCFDATMGPSKCPSRCDCY